MVNLWKIPSWVVVSALLSLPALNAQTVFTSPSGYVKLKATAALSASEPSFNFVNHALAQDRKSSGIITAGGTDTITASASSWGVDDFAGSNGAHFVVLTNGDEEGTVYEISSNTSDTLTLETGSGDTSTHVGDTFRIYQHNTLGSIFGADPVANGVVAAFDAASADQVQIYDVASGGFQTYYYKNVDSAFDPNDVIGWVEAGDTSEEVSSTVIGPSVGFIYLRRDDTTSLEIPVFGDVIDSTIAVSIVPGFNLVSVPTPIDSGVTLGNSGLAPANPNDPIDLNIHLEAAFDAASAEQIFIWNGSGYDTYYFKNVDSAFDPSDVVGWVEAGNTSLEVSSTTLESGGFFITRKVGNPALEWIFPSVTP